MTDLQTTSPEMKAPSNLQMEVPVLSSEERKKEFYKELNAIKEKALSEVSEPTKPEVQLPLDIDEAPSIVEVENKENNNDSSRNNPIDDSGDFNDVSDIETSGNDELDNKPIPKKRLDKEVKKRQELEERLQLERDARIKTETELNLYTEALKKLSSGKEQLAQQQDIDPIDSDAHRFYMSKIDQLEKKLEERTHNLSESQLRTRFETTVNAQSNEFSKAQPDFEKAYKYVVDREVETARLLGMSDSDANAFAMQKLQPIAMQIYNNGGNVAEGLYKIAKNYGYVSKPATATSKGAGVNLKAIEKNSMKSSSIIDDVPASSTGIAQPATAYTSLEKFSDNLTNADGRGTDEVKFRKLLKQIANG